MPPGDYKEATMPRPLHDDAVRLIKQYRHAGYSVTNIAKALKVSRSCVSDVVNGRTHVGIRDDPNLPPLRTVSLDSTPVRADGQTEAEVADQAQAQAAREAYARIMAQAAPIEGEYREIPETTAEPIEAEYRELDTPDADLDALQDAQETVDQAEPLAPRAKPKARRRGRSGPERGVIAPSAERLIQGLRQAQSR